ncbi:MAG: hypothetical protein E7665_02075 [Ruminococcaceae bacterium]|nr:hypothetical protein [Oscillospiraceae bacterium]
MNDLIISGISESKLSALGEIDLIFGKDASEIIFEYNTEDALACAKKGDTILFIDENYPRITDRIFDAAFFEKVSKKELSVFIEYPSELYGYELGSVTTASKERQVVRGDFFGEELSDERIMSANTCFFRHADVSLENVLISTVRVAGYDKAAYPINESETPSHPFLFIHEKYKKAVICTSSLSVFAKARYAPKKSWRDVISKVISYLTGVSTEISVKYDVRPAYDRDDALPADAYSKAFEKCSEWFTKTCITGTYDAKSVIEGFSSEIDYKGDQTSHSVIRPDCVGEATMLTALDYLVTKNPVSKLDSISILKYSTLKKSILFPESTILVSEKDSPMYGLMNWTTTQKLFYGDDNARALLGMIAARSIIGSEADEALPLLDEDIIRCTLANLRTTGINGFRHSSLSERDFKDRSWEYYYNEDLIEPTPHYTAYLWTLYLEIYALTGIEELFVRAKKAIRYCMEIGYKKWRWQNSLSGELTRMLLPLSFLVRVEDNEENRRWLSDMVDLVLSLMDESGAVHDMYGECSLGHYPPTRSNAAYGTTEAPLIQYNTDPATDLLYTTNWAAIGLHEAYLVLKDERTKNARDKLFDFLCRIQVKSDKHPYLDGAWMRAFDFDKWDYWASGADSGWGACCIESGWTNTWIASAFAFRLTETSLFRDDLKKDFSEKAKAVAEEML